MLANRHRIEGCDAGLDRSGCFRNGRSLPETGKMTKPRVRPGASSGSSAGTKNLKDMARNDRPNATRERASRAEPTPVRLVRSGTLLERPVLPAS
jgi:hypothetical protein